GVKQFAPPCQRLRVFVDVEVEHEHVAGTRPGEDAHIPARDMFAVCPVPPPEREVRYEDIFQRGPLRQVRPFPAALGLARRPAGDDLQAAGAVHGRPLRRLREVRIKPGGVELVRLGWYIHGALRFTCAVKRMAEKGRAGLTNTPGPHHSTDQPKSSAATDCVGGAARMPPVDGAAPLTADDADAVVAVVAPLTFAIWRKSPRGAQ